MTPEIMLAGSRHAHNTVLCISTDLQAAAVVKCSFAESQAAVSSADTQDAASAADSDLDFEERDQDGAQDALAANLGIDDFSAMLRHTERQEEAEAAGNVKRSKYVQLHDSATQGPLS